jgi:hypothetical protein
VFLIAAKHGGKIVALVIGGQLKVARKFRGVKGNPPGAQRQHCRQCGDPMIFDGATGRYVCSSGKHKQESNE